MYDNLQKINLTEYLNKCCGGTNWVKESWLVFLDSYVGLLSKENTNILKLKINNNLNHYQINDIVNEIMIACVYHPEANFFKENNKKTFDLFDKNLNLKIEVKTLNEGDDEKERHKQDKFICISKCLNVLEEKNEKQQTKKIIYKKCTDHLTKASSQINNKGKIYLIYDYNTLTSENIGTKKEPRFTRTHRSALSKDDIKNEINNFLNNFSKNHPQITVEAIYFGDLRDKVINSK
ncbi:hypothetical protein A2331_04770 [Candidatus Falkowbacteria bacterium RIFOXYB2_FULL_34_18]|uniref:Restriction endonuclease n=1 Tax=Candidatus Falkowbacteria bacterium RIFOXYD2_FULL_34_120 TaxID=1798007 RepID=A0A1F5TQA6_9BACT|nr:MAG: hypothetical protein A2331_04770 [Candidatus Falkowbacteria bacterium RIFOXYB2_FULL_34_18]OGF29373.1 MAG: hypothetical protein A2500_06355 [Candidatus Falkowbacteria bacterium RIFOXYC12_FULL_34_55]OGF36564.1 MAG: hypothetical protein A2466_07395 [Candidatus Falkowbacteria bacterium RIFOXYC2_FULL_34_220]OGF38796.1 MAG: hypothetical protein A2515_03505 [Candidatus Falkowbacteria bacterium RIFOXYD12_FULL_34_57]OGF41037.1 MAG: hypothetical protein A2531_03750 [Candidatus Falkowbacteria bact